MNGKGGGCASIFLAAFLSVVMIQEQADGMTHPASNVEQHFKNAIIDPEIIGQLPCKTQRSQPRATRKVNLTFIPFVAAQAR